MAAISSPTYRDLLTLVWPASLAALIAPMLGIVDSFVLSRSPRPFDIGAVALAASVFSIVYWTFGFLRLTTAGLTAQAVGAQDQMRIRRALVQGCGVAFIAGLVFLFAREPFARWAFALLTDHATTGAETLTSAVDYYDIRIWAAPFSMAAYTALGWLTAQGRVGLLLVYTLVTIGMNAALDVYFVSVLRLGAKGVALGTLIAEMVGFLVIVAAILHVLHHTGGINAHWRNMSIWHARILRQFVGVNRDNFLRSFILVIVFLYFTKASAEYGDLILSANEVLLQAFLVTGMALDGTAIAAETLIGQAIGRDTYLKRRDEFYAVLKKLAVVTAFLAFALYAAYVLFGAPLVTLLVSDAAIHHEALRYLPWVSISPLIVSAGFLLDGVYIGATRSVVMRNGMIVSGLVYALCIWYFTPRWGNHGLWAAFSAFMVARAVTLLLGLRGFDPLLRKGI